MSERCKCGEPHDNWPGADGGMLCQMCWEAECDKSWWAQVKAIGEVQARVRGQKCTSADRGDGGSNE